MEEICLERYDNGMDEPDLEDDGDVSRDEGSD